MPDEPFNPNRVIELPDAGKNKFSELLYARKFLRKVKLRTHEKSWFIYNGRAWDLTKAAYWESLAVGLPPEQHRNAKHARSVIDLAQMMQQIAADQAFCGAIRFDRGRSEVLINCGNGVLRVSAGEAKLQKHDEEMLFTGAMEAAWQGKDYETKDTPPFTRVLGEVLPESKDQAQRDT